MSSPLVFQVARSAPPTATLRDLGVQLPDQKNESKGIRPNRYANLCGEFEHAVYLPKELWDHLGSEERVIAALKRLADVSRDEGGRGAAE